MNLTKPYFTSVCNKCFTLIEWFSKRVYKLGVNLSYNLLLKIQVKICAGEIITPQKVV
jgi:hypothetical protein